MVYASTDTPGFHDSSGAFQPEARAYTKLHGFGECDVVPVSCDRPRPQRRLTLLRAIENAISEKRRYDVVAYFGHGTWQSMQLGYDLGNVLELGVALRQVLTEHGVIALYACSTADGPAPDQTDVASDLGPACERGFADRLRDALSASPEQWYGHVDAHKIRGHATWNPYVVRLHSGTETEWIVEPGSDLWPRWKLALRSTDMRHRFPQMTTEQIQSELRGA